MGFGNGRFLLRKLNGLYAADSSLQENLLMNFSTDLLWVTVTPDGKQIVVETAGDDRSVKDTQSGTEPASEKASSKYQIRFLDATSLAVQRTLKLNQIVNLDATSTGFADTIHKGDLWLVRFGPSLAERQNLARVRSHCVPELIYSSSNSLLIGRCPLTGDEYSVSAFTVTGRRLWRQHWGQHRYYPTVMRSEDSSRFGFSTLRVAPTSDSPTNSADGSSSMDNDPNRGIEQVIEIYETASGSPIQSLRASPVVMSGQNFSFSPDGRRLAVLHDSTSSFTTCRRCLRRSRRNSLR